MCRDFFPPIYTAHLAALSLRIQLAPLDRPRREDHMKDLQQSERLLALPTVLERTALKRASLYAAMDRGEFPRPIRLSSNRVAWVESRIQAWIAAKINEAA